ncbi:terpene synthase family protein [Dyadobacter jiangsuensis]|uniref:Terpene synthase n=1 Tax=Dyadobacter jiangsuensis TaxID=1591085 RepID=A0A2P8FI76_9BACT|nr:terpene synthase family protein [Dyadobacter jiangsuensis]PSL21429.1 hypothetical protein CLV60_12246 [Dyadobacter jiangsuensis]
MRIQEFNPKDYLPQGYYPWPDLINPHIEKMGIDQIHWIDEDYTYLTEKQQKKYKKMRLHCCIARMLPYASLERITPCHRFILFQSVFDDQLEYKTAEEIDVMRHRLVEVFNGSQPESFENGLLRQAYKIGEEFRAFMPTTWVARFIDAFHRVTRYGVVDEAPYKQNKTAMSLIYYLINREYSILMYPYLYMIDIETHFVFPDLLDKHPVIQRLRTLTSRIIGWQNDIQGLSKELTLETEVTNLIVVLQHEYNLSLKEALTEAMKIHDADLAEFTDLASVLPAFGEYKERVERFILGLGLQIQGVNSFYLNDTTRYLPDGSGFAWPEERSLKLKDE